MNQKPKGIKKNAKPAKLIKPAKPAKPAKKLTSVERAIGNTDSAHKSKVKPNDEAYDRGFNDGYSKGLEDCGLDESR
ncbi:MAG: hypothetical protein WD424_05065 [Paenibacillaceae bacterium]